MEKRDWPVTFQDAVACFVKSLNEAEKIEFLKIDVFNPHVEDGGRYIAKIQSMFGLFQNANKELLKNIAKENPDKVFSMDFSSDTADPLLACQLIIEEAKNMLLKSTRK